MLCYYVTLIALFYYISLALFETNYFVLCVFTEEHLKFDFIHGILNKNLLINHFLFI